METRYKTIKHIGEGAFSSVILALNVETSEQVAIKRMKKRRWKDTAAQSEINALQQLHHENVIRLLDVFREDYRSFLVFERMDCDLNELVVSRAGRKLPETVVLDITSQVLSGLSFIHKAGLFHRDIKPENVLIRRKVTRTVEGAPKTIILQAKIADFGLVHEVEHARPLTDYISTRWYRAPEVLLADPEYSAAIDVWAVGTIVAELAALRPLFPGANQVDQLRRIFELLGTPYNPPLGGSNGKILDKDGSWLEGVSLLKGMGVSFVQSKRKPLGPALPEVSYAVTQLVDYLLVLNPHQRPTAEMALEVVSRMLDHTLGEPLLVSPTNEEEKKEEAVVPESVEITEEAAAVVPETADSSDAESIQSSASIATASSSMVTREIKSPEPQREPSMEVSIVTKLHREPVRDPRADLSGLAKRTSKSEHIRKAASIIRLSSTNLIKPPTDPTPPVPQLPSVSNPITPANEEPVVMLKRSKSDLAIQLDLAIPDEVSTTTQQTVDKRNEWIANTQRLRKKLAEKDSAKKKKETIVGRRRSQSLSLEHVDLNGFAPLTFDAQSLFRQSIWDHPSPMQKQPSYIRRENEAAQQAMLSPVDRLATFSDIRQKYSSQEKSPQGAGRFLSKVKNAFNGGGGGSSPRMYNGQELVQPVRQRVAGGLKQRGAQKSQLPPRIDFELDCTMLTPESLYPANSNSEDASIFQPSDTQPPPSAVSRAARRIVNTSTRSRQTQYDYNFGSQLFESLDSDLVLLKTDAFREIEEKLGMGNGSLFSDGGSGGGGGPMVYQQMTRQNRPKAPRKKSPTLVVGKLNSGGKKKPKDVTAATAYTAAAINSIVAHNAKARSVSN